MPVRDDTVREEIMQVGDALARSGRAPGQDLRSCCATASACGWKPCGRSWMHSTRPSR